MARLTNAIVILFALLAVFGGEAAAKYNPEIGRFMQRDPVGYVDGTNLYQYVRSMPVSGIDPFGLKLVVDGDAAYRSSVERALQEICPGAKVEEDGSVTVGSCEDNTEHEQGCECLSSLSGSSKTHTIRNGDPGEKPYTVPANDEDWDKISQPGVGTDSVVNWDPSVSLWEDPANIYGPRQPVRDSAVLAHELCGHSQDMDQGTDPGYTHPSVLIDGVRPHEVRPRKIENQIREEMGQGRRRGSYGIDEI